MHAGEILSAHLQQKKNIYLNGKKVLQPKVTEMTNTYLNEDTENYNEMRNNLSQYKNIFQYVYSNIFTEIYCSIELREFDLKGSFHIMFKTYKDKKRWKCSVKNPKITRKYVFYVGKFLRERSMN